MSKITTILSPTSYVAPSALGFSDPAGNFSLVTPQAPLPVVVTGGGTQPVEALPPPTPLAGDAAGSTVTGPFKATVNRPIHVQLSGVWTGSVSLERSIDDGKSRYPLTVGGMPWAVFNSNANEPVWQDSEVGATFYLNIALQSGTIAYRVSQ
ncbi:hypothetical protein [Croceibacterium ferulae]|uniref:hypothetical protein n=1 Tax=Croceibacterium ferulae TaxID=1854641 RepID=UPI000F88E9AF|nr:hypothetical protein [Croceibacterium ferulae]